MITIPPEYRSRCETYDKLWSTLILDPSKISVIDEVVRKIQTGKVAYEQVKRFTGVPAHVVGIIHAMESDCDFTTHLFNGDPLTDCTKNEPKGQPVKGTPPFSWQEGAIAALDYDKLNSKGAWSISGTCYALESYNGWGYVPTPTYSPYLWSFTDKYKQGKYFEDGTFDPSAKSEQPGAIAILKRMIDVGLVKIQPVWV